MVKTEKNPCPESSTYVFSADYVNGLIERMGKKIVKSNGLEKCIAKIEIYFYDKKKKKFCVN